jgi:hypothetical protein
MAAVPCRVGGRNSGGQSRQRFGNRKLLGRDDAVIIFISVFVMKVNYTNTEIKIKY